MTALGFNIVALNNTVLGGVENPNYDRREEQKTLGGDGQIHQTGATVITAAPMASFTTIAVRALAAIITSSPQLPWVALDGANGLELWGIQMAASGPGYTAGSTHVLKQAVSGDLYIKSLRWSIGEVLTADVDAFFVSSSGSADPVTSSAAAAAPTFAVNTEQLTLTGVTANGTTVNNVVSIDLAIDHKGENNVKDVCYASGLPYPVITSKAGVGGQSEILLTIETTDLTTALSGVVIMTFGVLNPLGVGQGATGLTVTLNGTIVRDQNLKGSNGQVGKRQVLIRGTYNGATKPLAMATF